MNLKFITGNKNKFEEVKKMLGLPLEQMVIDLPEIQSLDAEEIIRQKLLAAEGHAPGQYIVEDTSVYLDCLGGKLPGPFIKWFEHAINPEGIAEMAKKMGNQKATVRTLVGFADSDGEMHFFEGIQRGTIVSPRGDKDFGWGPIFQPEDCPRTYGEMEREEKYRVSMRAVAIKKLRDFLEH